MNPNDDKLQKPGRSPVQPLKQKGGKGKEEPSGYPEYPDKEDIYIQYHEESDLNPEDITKKKDLNTFNEMDNDSDLNDLPVNDLDVPGGELDDDQEEIGSEDEENNYYSLGDDYSEEETGDK
jgi:hypothetical protein